MNISGQACRDLRGIQIVIIDGTACEIQTYKIKKCISLGNQDDIFIEMDSLEIGKEYLVQVDGYLNDFCAFVIEVSNQPKGLPLMEKVTVQAGAEILDDQKVMLHWDVIDSVANIIRKYEVWRMYQNSFKSKLIHEVAQGFNAYGSPKLTFSIEDNISDYGVYYYKIIGVSDQARFLISRTSVQNTEPKNEHDENRHWLAIDLYYPYSCKLEISLFDAKSQELLNYFTFNYSFENQTFETYIKDYIDEGITEYLAIVENLGNGEKQKYLIKK